MVSLVAMGMVAVITFFVSMTALGEKKLNIWLSTLGLHLFSLFFLFFFSEGDIWINATLLLMGLIFVVAVQMFFYRKIVSLG